MAFSVSAWEGGKVISFKRAGRELLTTKDIHPLYYGATLWFSPQADYWPPDEGLDRRPYCVVVTPGSILVKQTTKQWLVTKQFSLSSKDTSIHLRYTVQNLSSAPRKLSPWDIVRVKGGWNFFQGQIIQPNSVTLPLNATSDNLIWYHPTDSLTVNGQKLFGVADQGWLAHYGDGLLFIKYFPHIAITDLPPSQGAIEIYTAPNAQYIELENHGKYRTLAPGQSLQYDQRWVLMWVGKKSRKELLNIIYRLDPHLKE